MKAKPKPKVKVKKAQAPTKVEGILTLSAFNGLHYLDRESMETDRERGGRPSFAESLSPIHYLIESIMGDDWANIGRKVKVTMEIVKTKEKK